MSQCVPHWIFLYASLHFLDLSVRFLSLGNFLAIISSNTFSGPFFSFWDPYNANAGTFNAVPEVSWTVHMSFLNSVPKQWFPAIWCPAHFFIFSSASFILLLIPSTVFFICYCSSLFFKASSSLLYPLRLCLHSFPEILDLLYYYYSEFFFKEIAYLHSA